MIAFSILFILIVSFKLIVLFGYLFNFKKVAELPDTELPKVSILVPARNEGKVLVKCMSAIARLDYPKEKIEVIVGNDQSTDNTRAIAMTMIKEQDFISLLDIEPNYHGLIARSNVLAQLAQVAKGEYLVFLDADMTVTPGWLRQMVAPTQKGYELVSGYTEVEGRNAFTRFQQMDWLNMILLLKVASDLGQPGTALGNNMLVSRKTYHAIGGYESIGPTFTEDNDLSLAMKHEGARLYQVVTDQGSFTLPIHDFKSLLKQRLRWFKGALKQPLQRLLPVLLSRLFMLWVILIAVWDIRYASALMLIVSFLDLLLSYAIAQRTRTKLAIHIAFFAPVFNSLLDTFTLLTYPWNRKVTWKGRKL